MEGLVARATSVDNPRRTGAAGPHSLAESVNRSIVGSRVVVADRRCRDDARACRRRALAQRPRAPRPTATRSGAFAWARASERGGVGAIGPRRALTSRPGAPARRSPSWRRCSPTANDGSAPNTATHEQPETPSEPGAPRDAALVSPTREGSPARQYETARDATRRVSLPRTDVEGKPRLGDFVR
jgi:hypothetical protein